MTNTVLRPVPGPLPPAATPVPAVSSYRGQPDVMPAYRIIPSLSPLIGDTGVLAETYARAAEKAAAERRAIRQP